MSALLLLEFPLGQEENILSFEGQKDSVERFMQMKWVGGAYHRNNIYHYLLYIERYPAKKIIRVNKKTMRIFVEEKKFGYK